MEKTKKNKPEEEPKVYEVDENTLASLAICGTCGNVYDTEVAEVCPYCLGSSEAKPGSNQVEDPPEEKLVCQGCGVNLNRSKLKVTGGFLSKRGLRCPVCQALVEEAKKGAEVENPGGKEPGSGPGVDWDKPLF